MNCPLPPRRRLRLRPNTLSIGAVALLLAGCVASDGKLYLMQHPGMERTDEAIAKKIDAWGSKSVANVKEANLNRKKQIEEEARKQAEREAWTQIGGAIGVAALASLKLWQLKRQNPSPRSNS